MHAPFLAFCFTFCLAFCFVFALCKVLYPCRACHDDWANTKLALHNISRASHAVMKLQQLYKPGMQSHAQEKGIFS